MKSQDELQFVHDLLVGILLDESPLVFKKKDLVTLKMAADVLCWVLEHDHNLTFTEITDSIIEQTVVGYFEK
jgi:hypothetical protein